MHAFGNIKKIISAASALLCVGLVGSAFAYPPAPHHEIHGLVRGEDGEPIMQDSAIIILETDTGVRVTGSIVPNLSPGDNYRLLIPMDAGVTPEPYVENALTPLVPFRIKVIIGTVTNLPIEMIGGFRNLGLPGESTRIDLTLGEDLDGDGLPDAWERILIAQLGGTLTIQDIGPNDDSDNDGLSNLHEYIAGTYAFDPEDGFSLTIRERTATASVLELTAISGRTYEIKCSSNMVDWVTVPFRVPSESPQLRSAYSASQVKPLVIEVPTDSRSSFYRGFVR
ncbi:MAG: hypothetical protein ACI9OU_002306 [Candidatus Promineifilaceae bacterium]|jgi:hypothetical protein